MVSCVGLLRIYFYFDIEVPWEHCTFGRLKLEEGYEDWTDFPIDGPGGERIKTIKMRHYYPTAQPGTVQAGSMARCKVSSSLLSP